VASPGALPKAPATHAPAVVEERGFEARERGTPYRYRKEYIEGIIEEWDRFSTFADVPPQKC
jgi:hypothetical protein